MRCRRRRPRKQRRRHGVRVAVVDSVGGARRRPHRRQPGRRPSAVRCERGEELCNAARYTGCEKVASRRNVTSSRRLCVAVAASCRRAARNAIAPPTESTTATRTPTTATAACRHQRNRSNDRRRQRRRVATAVRVPLKRTGVTSTALQSRVTYTAIHCVTRHRKFHHRFIHRTAACMSCGLL